MTEYDPVWIIWDDTGKNIYTEKNMYFHWHFFCHWKPNNVTSSSGAGALRSSGPQVLESLGSQVSRFSDPQNLGSFVLSSVVLRSSGLNVVRSSGLQALRS